MIKQIKFNLFHITLLILGPLGLVSCGGEYGKEGTSISARGVGEAIEFSSKLDELSKSNLRHICSRLRAMRMDVRSTTDIRNILFGVTVGSCMGNSTTKDVRATFDAVFGSQINYRSITNNSYLVETLMQTDEDGVLSKFCPAILNGDTAQVDQFYAAYLSQGSVYAFPTNNSFNVNLVIANDRGQNILVEKYIYTLEANVEAARNAVIERVEYQSECSNGNTKTDIQQVKEYSVN